MSSFHEREAEDAREEERRQRQAERLSRPLVGPFAAVPVYGIIDPDYARIFTMARVLAWQEGYALLFHGSFTRDLDLIAVPWTATACDPEHLVARIAEASDLNILGKQNAEETKHGSPKEHGRRAWTLTFKAFGDPRFVDFSIMPRKVEREAD